MVPTRSVVRLGPQEIETLQALAKRKPIPVASHQRLRLEMLGLARDGPGGLRITVAGRKYLDEASAFAFRSEPDDEAVTARRDALGRRRGNHRLVFT
jgi:hypothetical protein